MKKTLSLALAACLLLLPLTAAYADIIYTPKSDFVSQHYGACTSVNRNFYVDSAKGATVYVEPGSDTVVGTVANGAQLRVYYTYEGDGIHWGLVEPQDWLHLEASEPPPQRADAGDDAPPEPEWSSREAGWLDMATMKLIYDGQSFAEEYADDIALAVVDWGDYARIPNTVIWSYPGASEPMYILEGGNVIDEPINDKVYTDAEGRRWAYGGKPSGWICLSDPTNTDLGTYRPVPHTGHWQPPAANRGPSVTAIAAALIAALAVGTALLIRLLYRPAPNRNR